MEANRVAPVFFCIEVETCGTTWGNMKWRQTYSKLKACEETNPGNVCRRKAVLFSSCRIQKHVVDLQRGLKFLSRQSAQRSVVAMGRTIADEAEDTFMTLRAIHEIRVDT